MKNGYDIQGIPQVGESTKQTESTDKKMLKSTEQRFNLDLGSFRFNMNFDFLRFNKSWLYPGLLVLIWFVVFIIFNFVLSKPNEALNILGIQGDLSVNNLISSHISMKDEKGIKMIFMLFIYILANVVEAGISLVTSAFIHVNFGHLLSNTILFLGIVACISIFDLGSVKQSVHRWFDFHVEILCAVWVLFEGIGWISMIFAPKIHTIFSEFTNNKTPIVGASVGILALLGWTMVVLYKTSKFSIKPKLIYIVCGVLFASALPILIQQINNLSGLNHYFTDVTSKNSLTAFLGIVHLVAFGLGVLSGLRCRVTSGNN